MPQPRIPAGPVSPRKASAGLPRREAVKLAAAATLSAPFLQSARAADAVVFGLVGAGARGRYLLGHLNGISTCRCAAICDTDEQSLRQALRAAHGSPQGLRDHRELLARKDISAVLIATPSYKHCAIARDALEAGKHVFVENPLFFKLEEAKVLKAAADAHASQVLQVGLQRRYSKFYQTARQMVAKGVLGEVTNIQTQWNCNPGWIIQPQQPRERNWRLFREFSGGLTAELVSHQVDLANWMFGDPPEFVSGVGGLDWKKDGRDIYDNVALIFKYPFGQKLVSTSLSTNKHLPLLSGGRSESGELILGTGGTIEITLGNDEQPALGLWFIEQGPKIGKAQGREEIAVIAGPTAAHRTGSPDGFPILLEQDQMTGQETFLERELKYARRWLYAKGIMVPQEECHPVRAELESFFDCCRTGRSPKADLEAGLNSSLAAILANRAMDEGRRVTFSEIES